MRVLPLTDHASSSATQPTMDDLDALMRLSHELGEVDDETWQLWQEGRTTSCSDQAGADQPGSSGDGP